MSDHHHIFEIKYRRNDGEIEAINPNKCKECEQLIYVRYHNGTWVTTLHPLKSEITYSVVAVESNRHD